MQTEGNEKQISKKVQYVTDDEGHMMAVIIPIQEFEEMMEDLHLGRVARESTSEPRRPFAEMVEEMRHAGEIDV
jgi:PHD/YefM family antitoxin component YafN of YafNO toxin-antitoxin module